MKQVFPFKLFGILMMLFLPILGIGQYTAEKFTNESIDIEVGAEFRVENKYGGISIIGWDQPGISIKSEISVRKKDKYAAEELLERISSEISNFGKLVSLKTEIAEKNAGFFGRLLSDVVDIDFGKSDIEINLEIKLPASTELEIINNFGDVVVADWSGILRSDIQHGDLYVADDFERASMDHSFGKISLQNVTKANINLKSGRLKCDTINDLRLDSQGSVVDVKVINFLNINSSKDEIRIVKVGRVKGYLRYGNTYLEEVSEEINLELSLADLSIHKLKADQPNVFIKQQNSDVDVNISQTAFELDVEMEGGIFRIPESIKDIESIMVDEKNNIRRISGKYGVVKKGKITLEGKKGFVIFREL